MAAAATRATPPHLLPDEHWHVWEHCREGTREHRAGHELQEGPATVELSPREQDGVRRGVGLLRGLASGIKRVGILTRDTSILTGHARKRFYGDGLVSRAVFWPAWLKGYFRRNQSRIINVDILAK